MKLEWKKMASVSCITPLGARFLLLSMYLLSGQGLGGGLGL